MGKAAKLEPTKVTALLKAGTKGTYPDGANLYLQVTGAGTGSWIFRYAERGSGRNGAKPVTHWLGLGATHTVSLKEARERAKKLRQQLLDGADPAKQRQEAKSAPAAQTFAEVAGLYIQGMEAGWSAIHARQWRSSLRDHVTPVIGSLAVSAIELGDVMRVLQPIWTTKTETASRVRQRLEAVLDYAKVSGWRTGDNPARWDGFLEHKLAAKESVAPVQHHPAMEWQKTPSFLASLANRQGTAAKALAFLILTAARSAEARGATWGEIDLSAAVWTVPPARMKANREHRIPLQDAAMAILHKLRPASPDPAALVFPGAKEGRPLSDVALAKLLPAGVTCHGFRACFRTWAGEKTEFPREVVEMALAHRLGDAVEQAYARGSLFTRRRALMEAWGAFLAGKVADGDNVVELRPVEAVA
ncbi:MAG TPA: integrase arm-type DNA-binding domain-containing protein [Acetobacteraceae bacterium]|nr:integrase arm-type DNA-binding domain-containing protein [Acetobacteraceae bacterium]